jgi:hypothetical protein
MGAILILVGLWFGYRELSDWQQLGFGNLDYPTSLRGVIPSVFSLMLGIQMVFSGFFLGVLQIFKK